MKKTLSAILITATLALSACTSSQSSQTIETTDHRQGINTVHIQEETYEYPFEENRSVYNLMIILQSEQNLSFEAKDYGEMGFLIEEINGISNGAEEDSYWIYYVNDKQANVGISQYILEPDDAITWKYKPYN